VTSSKRTIARDSLWSSGKCRSARNVRTRFRCRALGRQYRPVWSAFTAISPCSMPTLARVYARDSRPPYK
jgi:hypothetical protein